MEKLKKIGRRIAGGMNKYWIAVVVFLVITFFFSGESNPIKRFSYKKQIQQLKTEIGHYTQEKEDNLQKLETLRSDNETLERLAREQYKMTQEDEELFLIIE